MASEVEDTIVAGPLKISKKRRHDLASFAKGAVLVFAGVHLGLATLKFIGRRLRGSKGAGSSPAQRAPAPALSPAAAQSEDYWNLVDAPAPPAPEGYKPIATATLQCTPQELYAALFSGQASDFYLAQHRDIGKQWDLVVSGWKKAPVAGGVLAGPCAPEAGSGAAGAAAAGGEPLSDSSLLGSKTVFEYVLGQPGSGGFTRLLTFWNPKKPPSSSDTRCVQRQQVAVYRGDVIVFATAMNMLDIPFKDCFTVNTLWRAAPGPSFGSCTLTITLKVNFLKRAMGVGGIISATTFRDTKAFYEAFVVGLEAHLQALRAQSGGALPQPQPAGVPATGRAARGTITTPFAAAATQGWARGAPAPGGATTTATLTKAMPVWKQLRALLVFAVFAVAILHQLHLSSEIASVKEHSGIAGGAAASTGVRRGLLAGVGVPGAAGVQAALQAVLGRMMRPQQAVGAGVQA